MAYQYKREPLMADEANRLASACQSVEEKFVIWTFGDHALHGPPLYFGHSTTRHV
jgi:hypothetical protein